MAITAAANPATLEWRHFREVASLPDGEDAHIDPHFDVPNRPLRKVDGQFALAESFVIAVTPRARVLTSASKTAALLAHEQGHYDIGLLAGWALGRALEGLRAATREALATALNDAFTLHTVTRLGPIQVKYDTDTGHGTIATQQQRWETLIRNALTAPPVAQLDGLPL